MSSKLVKKLLQQTAAPLTNSDNYDDSNTQQSQLPQKKKYVKSSVKVSKEDIVQEHIQSMLRLDNLVTKYSSSTAQKSFSRQSTKIKQQQKEKQALKRSKAGGGALGNSRSSSSSFTQKTHEERFDKTREKRKKENGYYEDLARALKKAKKGGSGKKKKR